jgi:hypothetical protein
VSIEAVSSTGGIEPIRRDSKGTKMRKAGAEPMLERMLRPIFEMLDEKTARRFADFKADEVVQARVHVLAEKCNEGQLTPKERSEYESIVAVGEILSVLKAKARYMLSKQPKAK